MSTVFKIISVKKTAARKDGTLSFFDGEVETLGKISARRDDIVSFNNKEITLTEKFTKDILEIKKRFEKQQQAWKEEGEIEKRAQIEQMKSTPAFMKAAPEVQDAAIAAMEATSAMGWANTMKTFETVLFHKFYQRNGVLKFK